MVIHSVGTDDKLFGDLGVGEALRLWELQGLFQPTPSLAPIAPDVPEPPQRSTQAQRQLTFPCPTSQASAARRFSISRSNRFHHWTCSAPLRCGSASSANAR